MYYVLVFLYRFVLVGVMKHDIKENNLFVISYNWLCRVIVSCARFIPARALFIIPV